MLDIKVVRQAPEEIATALAALRALWAPKVASSRVRRSPARSRGPPAGRRLRVGAGCARGGAQGDVMFVVGA